jgi:hypothetical protein
MRRKGCIHHQLVLQRLSGQQTLQDVGSIQAVHTVGAEHATLLHHHATVSLLVKVPATHNAWL